VPSIYQKYRTGIDRISSTFIRQTVREGLQNGFSKWTAQQIYSEKKEIVRGEAQQFLTDRLTAEGFIISQFTLNDVRVPKQITDAINAKVARDQEAQMALATVRKTEAEAAQRTAQAKGEADALRLKADAEAYYNQTVAKSLTPEFVQYQAQQRWDGQLPQATGGAALPFIQLGAK
jgi:regulator of protease activity HflC (stomatin/prohibitin superfamily)